MLFLLSLLICIKSDTNEYEYEDEACVTIKNYFKEANNITLKIKGKLALLMIKWPETTMKIKQNNYVYEVNLFNNYSLFTFTSDTEVKLSTFSDIQFCIIKLEFGLQIRSFKNHLISNKKENEIKDFQLKKDATYFISVFGPYNVTGSVSNVNFYYNSTSIHPEVESIDFTNIYNSSYFIGDSTDAGKLKQIKITSENSEPTIPLTYDNVGYEIKNEAIGMNIKTNIEEIQKINITYGFIITNNTLPELIQNEYNLFYQCLYNDGNSINIDYKKKNNFFVPIEKPCSSIEIYFSRNGQKSENKFTEGFHYMNYPTVSLSELSYENWKVKYILSIINRLNNNHAYLGKPYVYVKLYNETSKYKRIDKDAQIYETILDSYNIQNDKYYADVYISTTKCPFINIINNSLVYDNNSFVGRVLYKTSNERPDNYITIQNISKNCLPYQLNFCLNNSILANNTLGYKYEGSSDVIEINETNTQLIQNSEFNATLLLIKSDFCTEQNYIIGTYQSKQDFYFNNEFQIDINMLPEKCRYPNSNPDSPENPTNAPENPTVAPENPTKAPENPTVAPENPTVAPENPTKKPEKNLTISDFTVDDNKNANIDFNGKDYSDEFEYNIEIKDDINSITINTNGKDVSLIIPEDKEEMTFIAPKEEGNVQEFSIIPKADKVTITLSANTLASIDAENEVNLKSENNEKLSLNQVSPKSKDFTLVSDVSIDIKEVIFSGIQEMKIQLKDESQIINITNMKIQPNSSGTINNAVIQNIVLAPLSSLKVVSNVDLSETSIDFPFNDDNKNQKQAPLSGELGESPKKIEMKERGFQYLENKQKILIAESSNLNFKCNDWSKTYNKGPFHTKFTSSECIKEKQNDVEIQRLYATYNDNDGKENDKGLSAGGIAGIVIACIVVVAVAIILIYFFVIRKKNQASSEKEAVEV